MNLTLQQETADTARKQLEAELKTETIRLQALRAAAQSALEKARAEAEAAEARKTENSDEASIGLSVPVKPKKKRKLDMVHVSETALNCNTTAKDSVKPSEDASTSALESLRRAKKSKKKHNAESGDRLSAFLVYQARQTFNNHTEIQNAINSQNLQRLKDQHEKEYARFLSR